MHIVCFSDIHGNFEKIKMPQGDLLIFCGDIGVDHTTLDDIKNFADFMNKQNFSYKVAIAGNHDFPLEDDRKERAENFFSEAGIYYLNDSYITIDQIKIWGSPICPYFHNFAFNRNDEDIEAHWNKIPVDIDILITHSPPFGILDQTSSGEHIGNEQLRDVVEAISPRYHIFGHVHESYGALEYLGVKYINAGLPSEGVYENRPIEFDF